MLMNVTESDDTMHDWLIEMLINMVCYTSANEMAIISEELTNSLVVVSQELGRPIVLGEDLQFLPPKEAKIIPFRRNEKKLEYNN